MNTYIFHLTFSGIAAKMSDMRPEQQTLLIYRLPNKGFIRLRITKHILPTSENH